MNRIHEANRRRWDAGAAAWAAGAEKGGVWRRWHREADLGRFYAEAVRILRPGGRLIVSEYHPFRRPWKPNRERLELEFAYFDRGPHEFPAEVGVPGLMQYEFHWTAGDYVQTVLGAGCRILAVEEFGAEPEDWEGAPLAGLPRVLLVAGEKL